MANNVGEWSTTPASNTSLGSTSLVENVMRVNGVNNAIRELMAQVAQGIIDGDFGANDPDLTDLIARWTAASTSGPASLDFQEDADNGTSRVRLTAPASLAADRTATFQDASGTVAYTADIPAAYTGGKQSFWIGAGSMTERASSPALISTYDSGSNDLTLTVGAFDTTTQEYLHFEFGMPKGWNEGTVTFTPYWTNTGGSSTQTVRWTLAGAAISNDDTLNASMGTAQNSDDTWLAQNDLHIGPESSAITIGGTPAEGDLVVFQISRDVANDNMSGDALLVGILLHITFNAATDA